jgi:coenzyme PQQ precursor peptide PqqA
MPWSKPDFQEITLNMEVTAYVNVDSTTRAPVEAPPSERPPALPLVLPLTASNE